MRYLLWILLSLCMALPASAQEGGFVLGLGTTMAMEDFDDLGPLDADDSRTIGAQLGYRVNDVLGVELEYQQISDFDIGENIGGFTFDGDVSGWLVAANARVYLPIESRFRPYVAGGIGYLDLDIDLSLSGFGLGVSASDSGNSVVYQLGAGLDVKVNDNWALEIQGMYRLPENELEDFAFYTVGAYLRYEF